ncbi:hypothetical protein [Streptomyces sp. NPDC056690]|uniref:hypothetical protein n=1 Tax=unclassified Streptomyces TaxID=2593676 RepID=UPI0036390C4F
MLAVPKSQQVKSLAGIWRIDQLISEAPDDAWQQLSCGDGAKAPRLFDWASAKLPVIDFFDGDEPTHRRWVLARRSIKRPDEIAYYLAYAAARPLTWFASSAPAGPSRNVSRPRRTSAAWTSTRFAAIRAGIDT